MNRPYGPSAGVRGLDSGPDYFGIFDIRQSDERGVRLIQLPDFGHQVGY